MVRSEISEDSKGSLGEPREREVDVGHAVILEKTVKLGNPGSTTSRR